jgi:protein XagA
MPLVRRYFCPCLLAALIVCWLSFALTPSALAGAWTQPQGQGQAIVTLSAYRADQDFANGLARTSRQRFEKIEFATYLEYGFAQGWSLGVTTSSQRQASRQNAMKTDTNAGLSDVGVFLRRQLWQADGQALATQLSFGFAGPDNDQRPKLIASRRDVKAELSYGFGTEIFGRGFFTDLAIGYRLRSGPPADEIRGDFTAGLTLSKNWQIIAQSLNSFGVRGTDSGESGMANSSALFDLSKVQLSAIISVDTQTALQFSSIVDVYGRRTSAGAAFLFGVWQGF